MLKPWIKLEKSSPVLGGQGNEEQSLHFLFHPKSQELRDRFESGSEVLIAHGESTQWMLFWFMRDIAYLWFLFQVIMEESGGEWGLLYKCGLVSLFVCLLFFFLLLHNEIISYACHSQRVRKAFMKEIVCVPSIY